MYSRITTLCKEIIPFPMIYHTYNIYTGIVLKMLTARGELPYSLNNPRIDISNIIISIENGLPNSIFLSKSKTSYNQA